MNHYSEYDGYRLLWRGKEVVRVERVRRTEQRGRLTEGKGRKTENRKRLTENRQRVFFDMPAFPEYQY